MKISDTSTLMLRRPTTGGEKKIYTFGQEKEGQKKMSALSSLFGSKSSSETEIFKIEEISEKCSVVLTFMGEPPIVYDKKTSATPFCFSLFGRNFELTFSETFLDGFNVVVKEMIDSKTSTTISTCNSKKQLEYRLSVSSRFCVQLGLSFLFFGMLCSDKQI
jgi:hypothetical protein